MISFKKLFLEFRLVGDGHCSTRIGGGMSSMCSSLSIEISNLSKLIIGLMSDERRVVSQITGNSIVVDNLSGKHQRKSQSGAPLALWEESTGKWGVSFSKCQSFRKCVQAMITSSIMTIYFKPRASSLGWERPTNPLDICSPRQWRNYHRKERIGAIWKPVLETK